MSLTYGDGRSAGRLLHPEPVAVADRIRGLDKTAEHLCRTGLWFDWCELRHLEPLAEVRRPHVELYARDLEARGLAPATVALKLVVLTGFYRYCVEEHLLEHSPAVHVRRPKVSQESTRLRLDRSQLGAFLVKARLSGGNDHVLACLLALNALRVSEACGTDLSDLALANGHSTRCGTPRSPPHGGS